MCGIHSQQSKICSIWPRTAQQTGRRKKRKEGITFALSEAENPPVFYIQCVPCDLCCKDPESSQAALSQQQVANLLKLVAVVACAIWEHVWWEYLVKLLSGKRLPSTQSSMFLTWLWWDTTCLSLLSYFWKWLCFEWGVGPQTLTNPVLYKL